MTDQLHASEEESGIIIDSDPVENEEADDESLETTQEESGAELAPADGDDHSKNDDGVQKAINKQHAKFREEERKRIEIEKEAKALREKLEAFEAEKAKVTIPDYPDPYDDDYDERLKAREEAIKRQAIQEAKEQSLHEQRKAQEDAAKKAEQERFDSVVAGYSSRVTALGLSPDEIRAAGEKVVSYGIDSQLAEHILKQEDGPLITKYLADNPIVLDELRHMTAIDAAMKINSDIRKVASVNKPQASTAPDPAETLTGRGAGEKVSPFIAGVTFE